MKFGDYNFEGPLSIEDVKELPGIYVVLRGATVLDVGESGYNFPHGQALNKRLRTHERRPRWELVVGRYKGKASAWPEALAACDGAFPKQKLVDKCREHSISYRGDKKELCAKLYQSRDKDIMAVMETALENLRKSLQAGPTIGDISFAVLYEPDNEKRQEIEDTLRRHYHPPCGFTPSAMRSEHEIRERLAIWKDVKEKINQAIDRGETWEGMGEKEKEAAEAFIGALEWVLPSL